jgi:hypothetical protein
MRRGRGLLLGLLALTACGSDKAATTGAPESAPASVVESVPATPARTVATAAETVPETTAVVATAEPIGDTIVAAPPTTASPADESQDTAPPSSPDSSEAPTTSAGEGQPFAFADDPLPPQADAVTDPVIAEAAVRYAYEHWILLDLDPELRSRIVQDGEINTDAIEAGLEGARGIIDGAGFSLETVSFTDAEHAVVLYRVWYRGNPSPIFPKPMTGDAIFQNGTWRLGGRTLCLLAFGAGLDCSGVNGDNPTSPTALRPTTVPEGYEWSVGGDQPDVVRVDGFGSWRSGGDDLTVRAEAMVGISALTPWDADAVLRTPHFNIGEEGTTSDVDGAPALVVDRREGSALAVIRRDDVALTFQSTVLTSEELIAFARTFAPTMASGTPPPPVRPPDVAFDFCPAAEIAAAAPDMTPDGLELYLARLGQLSAARDLSERDGVRVAEAMLAVRVSYEAFRLRGERFTTEPVIDEINRICGTDYSPFMAIA